MKMKLLFLLLSSCLLLFGLTSLNLSDARPVQAGPLAGFTPTPVPPPPPPPPEPTPEEDEDDDEPTDEIVVRLDHCSELMCSINAPDQNLEVLAQVQLIHEGSGWIVEGIISNQGSTRFIVPYPGRWQVFLLDEPELLFPEGTQGSIPSFLNTAITTSYSGQPTLMGTIEANAVEVQLVDCPFQCLDVPPPELPDTGADLATGDSEFILLLILIGTNLVLMGLFEYINFSAADSGKRK